MTARNILFGLVVMALVFAIPIYAQNEKNVTLSGHTFKADLPNCWVLSSDSNKPLFG
jgi:hypothetical protein